MMESLSTSQARKLVLLSQKLPPAGKKISKGQTLSATLSAIEHLGYIQIDTLSVVQRAHHHTLWNRNASYTPSHLDQLLKEKSIFEYWSHAAAYLPMRDYRFSLVRKSAIKEGRQKHWHKPDPALMTSILKRIEHEGPLMAKDFVSETRKSTNKEWSSNPNKQALETLFMQGDLLITERKNFHKVYDLTERALPNHVDTTMPTNDDYARFLVIRFLEANGVGNAAEMAYLLKNIKPTVNTMLHEMSEHGDIIKVSIHNTPYYALPDSLALLNKPLSKRHAKILSPFDNLLIQRKRAQALFNFDYLLECYVPAAKREFGYFCLPILWDGKLVARADCKADKKSAVLNVLHLILEPTLSKKEAFLSALEAELSAFAQFNGCDRFHINRLSSL